MSMLIFNVHPPLVTTADTSNKTPTVIITLYAGEAANNKLGFGTSPSNLTSPGPTLRFNVSDIVSITVVNVGQMPHAFAITTAPKTGSNVLFNAQIASSANPLQPGQRESVVFAPNNGGSYYYICPVPGHAELGMYGSVVITG